MTIKGFVLSLLLASVYAEAPTQAPAKKPNIVFIVADDLGWDDVSFHGSPQIPTPNIDALALSGVILNNYYVSPSSFATKCEMMTGKYATRLGVQHGVIHNKQPIALPEGEKILPQYMKELGYNTHAIGKWSLGFYKESLLPWNRGFDTFFGGLTSSGADYYTYSAYDENYGLDLRRNEEVVHNETGHYITNIYTTEAVKLIKQHNESAPLFLYVAHQAVHSGNADDPLQAPVEYVKKVSHIRNSKRRLFGGMVTALDESLQNITIALSSKGILDNTVIIFSTTAGGAVGGMELNMGSNFPLRGSKMTVWEGGIRGVAFVYSSEKIQENSRVNEEMFHATDWMPTILGLAGGDWKSMKTIDGFNVWDAISNENYMSPRFEILHQFDPLQKNQCGLRVGDYKLIINQDLGFYGDWYPRPAEVGELQDLTKPSTLPNAKVTCDKSYPHPFLEMHAPPCDPMRKPCLFNIQWDPCEFHNLADFMPNTLKVLLDRLHYYRTRIVKPLYPRFDPNADPEYHDGVWGPWVNTTSLHEEFSPVAFIPMPGVGSATLLSTAANNTIPVIAQPTIHQKDLVYPAAGVMAVISPSLLTSGSNITFPASMFTVNKTTDSVIPSVATASFMPTASSIPYTPYAPNDNPNISTVTAVPENYTIPALPTVYSNGTTAESSVVPPAESLDVVTDTGDHVHISVKTANGTKSQAHEFTTIVGDVVEGGNIDTSLNVKGKTTHIDVLQNETSALPVESSTTLDQFQINKNRNVTATGVAQSGITYATTTTNTQQNVEAMTYDSGPVHSTTDGAAEVLAAPPVPAIATAPAETEVPSVNVTVPDVTVAAAVPAPPFANMTVPAIPAAPAVPEAPAGDVTVSAFPAVPEVPAVNVTVPVFPAFPEAPAVNVTAPFVPAFPAVPEALAVNVTVPTAPVALAEAVAPAVNATSAVGNENVTIQEPPPAAAVASPQPTGGEAAGPQVPSTGSLTPAETPNAEPAPPPVPVASETKAPEVPSKPVVPVQEQPPPQPESTTKAESSLVSPYNVAQASEPVAVPSNPLSPLSPAIPLPPAQPVQPAQASLRPGEKSGSQLGMGATSDVKVDHDVAINAGAGTFSEAKTDSKLPALQNPHVIAGLTNLAEAGKPGKSGMASEVAILTGTGIPEAKGQKAVAQNFVKEPKYDSPMEPAYDMPTDPFSEFKSRPAPQWSKHETSKTGTATGAGSTTESETVVGAGASTGSGSKVNQKQGPKLNESPTSTETEVPEKGEAAVKAPSMPQAAETKEDAVAKAAPALAPVNGTVTTVTLSQAAKLINKTIPVSSGGLTEVTIAKGANQSIGTLGGPAQKAKLDSLLKPGLVKPGLVNSLNAISLNGPLGKGMNLAIANVGHNDLPNSDIAGHRTFQSVVDLVSDSSNQICLPGTRDCIPHQGPDEVSKEPEAPNIATSMLAKSEELPSKNNSSALPAEGKASTQGSSIVEPGTQATSNQASPDARNMSVSDIVVASPEDEPILPGSEKLHKFFGEIKVDNKKMFYVSGTASEEKDVVFPSSSSEQPLRNDVKKHNIGFNIMMPTNEIKQVTPSPKFKERTKIEGATKFTHMTPEGRIKTKSEIKKVFDMISDPTRTRKMKVPEAESSQKVVSKGNIADDSDLPGDTLDIGAMKPTKGTGKASKGFISNTVIGSSVSGSDLQSPIDITSSETNATEGKSGAEKKSKAPSTIEAGDLGSIVTLVGKVKVDRLSSKRTKHNSSKEQEKKDKTKNMSTVNHMKHNGTETNAANIDKLSGPSNSIIVSSVIVVLIASFVVVGMAVVAVVAVVARHCRLGKNMEAT